MQNIKYLFGVLIYLEINWNGINHILAPVGALKRGKSRKFDEKVSEEQKT